MSGVEEISDEQYLIQRAKHQLVERLPAPVEMTEAERYRWIAEFCDEMKYFKPTPVSVGHYLVIDCEGKKTPLPCLPQGVWQRGIHATASGGSAPSERARQMHFPKVQ